MPMNPIKSLRSAASVTQAMLAKAGGTSQPTVAAYEADRKSPTIDTLRRLAESVGLEPSIEFHPPMTREERRSLRLHRAIGRRLSADPAAVVAQARENLARMMNRSDDSIWLKEWWALLDRPVKALLPVLTDRSPWARELRHVTPFAGVLTNAERLAVYADFAEKGVTD